MSINSWLKKNCKSLKHKTIVITGTTNGLGFETLKLLCRLEANVIVGVRNTAKAEAQKKELLKTYPTAEITILKVDLSDARSIKDFSNRVHFLSSFGIDALVCNAGVFAKEKQILPNGHEIHFFTNFVAPIYLSKKLMPLLEMKESSKIVLLGSLSQNFTKLNFEDIEFSKTEKMVDAYANSKRLLAYAAQKLKTESEKVIVNLVHPGISPTSLVLNSSAKVLSPFIKLLFSNAKKACLTELAGIFSYTKSNEWIGPSVFGVWGRPKVLKHKIKNFSNEEFQKCNEVLDEILNTMP